MAHERLQKVLASRGVASRRAAEEMIAAGAVTVNDRPAHVGQVVDVARDQIAVRGRPVLDVAPRRYLALNKPVGFVTSTRRQRDERTVADLLVAGNRLYPVGRLDKDTSGLLLLTNDGEWANLIAHPRYEVEKEYLATVRGVPTRSALAALRRGVTLSAGTRTAPARVEVERASGGEAVLDIVVHEGKKRQIRLMLEAVGYPVVALRRVRVGPIRLGRLREGQSRELADEEVRAIRDLARGMAGQPNE